MRHEQICCFVSLICVCFIGGQMPQSVSYSLFYWVQGITNTNKNKQTYTESAERCLQSNWQQATATGNWQHVAEQQFMMLPLTGECCLQLLMTMMIPRMRLRDECDAANSY